MSILPPPSSVKKLRDMDFSSSRRDSQPKNFRQDGNNRQTTSMASSGGFRIVRDSVFEYYGRNHISDY